jgi:hypothetical protein
VGSSKRADRVRSLSSLDVRLLLRALPVALFVRLALQRMTLPRLSARLGVSLDPVSSSRPAPSREMAVAAYSAASRLRRVLGDRSPCLERALLAGWLLRRDHPQLIVGWDAASGAAAHAWIDAGGMVVGDISRTEFTPLLRHRPGPAE